MNTLSLPRYAADAIGPPQRPAMVLRQKEDAMARYQVRRFESGDFEMIMGLEEDIFGDPDEGTLGPYYVRLCCDFFRDTCWLATADGEPAGYLLSFVKDREAYCTTLAIAPRFQGTRVVHLLLKAFVQSILGRVDSCWFTVKEDNLAARALHARLGAVDVEVRRGFYGPGDDRIVSRIDRPRFESLRARYERLDLVPDGDRPGERGLAV
jgi:ribosomal protein S18 acetylase RimI-like enzyme